MACPHGDAFAHHETVDEEGWPGWVFVCPDCHASWFEGY